ncbi:MAG: hypothetical protein GC161_10685 [Planctomycetaceae bacterium]|nr:hypothetical protein [Planctomycetaceae bacterium]
MATQEDDLPVGVLSVIGMGSLLFTLVTVILIVGLYRHGESAEFERKVVELPYTVVESNRATGEQRLSSYGWVDREAGRVHIPIDKAMGMIVNESQKR